MQCYCVAWSLPKSNIFKTFKMKNIIPLAHQKMCLPFLTGCNYENFCCLHVLIGFKSNHNHIMYIYSLQQRTMFISTNLFCFWYLQLCFKSVRAYYNGKMHDTESLLNLTINQYELYDKQISNVEMLRYIYIGKCFELLFSCVYSDL